MTLFLIILALISIHPYLSSKFPYTHDGENHLARFANYKIAIREGQFPPRFAPNLLNHYGYPVFNYNYPLANVLSLPFSFLKINYELTFKILVFSFILFGLFGVNHWLKTHKIEKTARFFSLAIFALTPYLINALSYRGNIGEIMAFNLLPWLFYFIDKQDKWKNKSLGNLFQVVVFTMFFLSHNVAVLFGTPLLIIYALYKYRKEISRQINLLTSFTLGLLSSLWFWLPAVLEKKQIILDNAELSQDYVNHFPTFSQLLFSPFEFGFSKVGSVDSLSFNLGLTTIFILLFSLIIVVKQRKKVNHYYRFLLSVIVLTVLFQLSLTSPIWGIIPLANFIQFPWRLTMFTNLLILPLAGFVFMNVNKTSKTILLFLVFIQLITVLKVRPADYFHKNIIDYDAFSQTTSTANENLPKEFTYSEFADWQPTPTILNGEGSINVINWQGSQRSYQLSLQSDSTIVEPTANFIGWETTANNEKMEYLDNEDIKGRLAYQLPAGDYTVSSKFTQKTWPRIIGNTISLGAILVTIIFVIKEYLPNVNKK